MKKNTILIDYQNLCFRTLYSKDVGVKTENPNFAIWRYFVFDSIYKTVWLYSRTHEVVVAIDDRNSWRKSYFNRYKESRKKNREKTGVDWKVVFDEIDKLSRDLKHHMPFKIFKIRSAEADDIIGTIATHTNNNCIIYSNDEDYLQLYSDRVKIWNPSKQNFVTCDNPQKFLVQKCLIGQKKDDIFNVITPNNWGKTKLTEGKRKPGFGIKAYDKISSDWRGWLNKQGEYKKLDVVVNPKNNYIRNSVLIDFRKIPKTIVNRIMDTYLNFTFPPPDNMYSFFKDNGMSGYLDDYTRVENKLLQLYG